MPDDGNSRGYRTPRWRTVTLRRIDGSFIAVGFHVERPVRAKVHFRRDLTVFKSDFGALSNAQSRLSAESACAVRCVVATSGEKSTPYLAHYRTPTSALSIVSIAAGVSLTATSAGDAGCKWLSSIIRVRCFRVDGLPQHLNRCRKRARHQPYRRCDASHQHQITCATSFSQELFSFVSFSLVDTLLGLEPNTSHRIRY